MALSTLAFANNDEITTNTQSFLDAYARGDRQKALSMVDPEITVVGSDLAEVFNVTIMVLEMKAPSDC